LKTEKGKISENGILFQKKGNPSADTYFGKLGKKLGKNGIILRK